MFCIKEVNLKAAILCAAFLFSQAGLANSAVEQLKNKTAELLVQKKKQQAIQVISNFIKSESNKEKKRQATELLTSVALKFVSREAQDLYEKGINAAIDNPKEAQKDIENCLALEPFQLECLIQKMRINHRLGNLKTSQETAKEIKELVPETKYEATCSLMAEKNKPDFKNKQIIKNFGNEKRDDYFYPLMIIEMERAFMVKNYSRAKDIISYFEKNISDWPDLYFYKHKINKESAEKKNKDENEAEDQITMYQNKCKSLNKTVARKFRYDFDLCARGIK